MKAAGVLKTHTMKDFKHAYNNIRTGERITVRDTIMKLCGWKHKEQFTMAKNGTRPPSEEQAKHIRRVFASVGINADTGREILK